MLGIFLGGEEGSTGVWAQGLTLAGALSLEPCPQPFVALVIFQIHSPIFDQGLAQTVILQPAWALANFVWADFKPWSSWSLPTEQLELQARAIMASLDAYDFCTITELKDPKSSHCMLGKHL
jgi:hypothetical protein